MACQYNVDIAKLNLEFPFGWVALSSLIVVIRSFRTFTYLHNMMFQTIQAIYFLWGHGPDNMSVSYSKL